MASTPLTKAALLTILCILFSVVQSITVSFHHLARAPRCSEDTVWCGRACCQECGTNGVCHRDPPPPPPPTPPKPILTITSYTATPYNELWIHGSGFTRNGQVTVYLYNTDGAQFAPGLPDQLGKSFSFLTSNGDCTGRRDMGISGYIIGLDHTSGVWSPKVRVRVCHFSQRIDPGTVLNPVHDK
ncbi:hypothetical protein BCR34DRAFT_577635 [Clohesyomyces aquaticus]|uniref:Uncharacterized protein n=1 Tax=Clohesyomyces aquaticus TaxID=1231657 RepID=A0A1Y1YJY3_9PLEO|nr:hypothetical protein BCR34DRAFT_577635 [Clohesyomyces aquaticus]